MDSFLAMFIYGVLLLLGVVAVGKTVQLKRQGAPLDKAITEGLIRAWEWVRKELQGFERLLMKAVFFFGVVSIATLLVLWAFAALLK